MIGTDGLVDLTNAFSPNRGRTLRVETDPLGETVAGLERAWRRLVPHRPFDYAFLDDTFEAQYRADVRFGQLFGLFAGLAVFVACLGLFGLAAFTAEQRTKEIGVRKVLGASAASIVALLSKEFTRLVLLAFLLAAPVAYLAAEQWLEDFAYRVPLGPGVFLLSGGAVFVTALLTVSYQAVRAALVDPVKSLRYE